MLSLRPLRPFGPPYGWASGFVVSSAERAGFAVFPYSRTRRTGCCYRKNRDTTHPLAPSLKREGPRRSPLAVASGRGRHGEPETRLSRQRRGSVEPVPTFASGGVSAVPRAPGERQPLSISLSSPRMDRPSLNHCPESARTARSLFGTNRSRGLEINNGKLSSRVPTSGVGTWRSHSAPSPIVPASKLYTTRTMLSSGEAFKKKNFVGILSNSSPVLASPFAPGGLARWPARDSPWVRPGPGLRPEGSLSFPCLLPTGNFPSP